MRSLTILYGFILSAQAATISKNAQCGGDSKTTCLNSQWGSCCSQHGWCGSTDAYCGTGCQPGFGSCKNTVRPSPSKVAVSSTKTASPVASPVQRVSENARCGAKFGSQTCLGSQFGDCCSQYFYCGSSLDYCGVHSCQKGYGRCDPSSSSSTISSSVVGSSFSTVASSVASSSLVSTSVASSSSIASLSSPSSTASSVATPVVLDVSPTPTPASSTSFSAISSSASDSSSTMSPSADVISSAITSPSSEVVSSSHIPSSSSDVVSSSTALLSSSAADSSIVPSSTPAEIISSSVIVLSSSEHVTSSAEPSSTRLEVISSSAMTSTSTEIVSSSASPTPSSSEAPSSSTNTAPSLSESIASSSSSVIVPSASPLPAGPNLLRNTGFETITAVGVSGVMEHWTSTGRVYPNRFPSAAHGGSCYAIMSVSPALTVPLSLSQTLTGLDTTRSYAATFYYLLFSMAQTTSCSLDVSINDQLVFTKKLLLTDLRGPLTYMGPVTTTPIPLPTGDARLTVRYSCATGPGSPPSSAMFLDDFSFSAVAT